MERGRSGSRARTAWGAGALLLASACAGALFTAPEGSTLEIIANPDFIPSHGGVSVIAAVITDATGSPVPDGTVVQFFTTLGRVDREGRTRDGVARVNLVSDARSGSATVTAVSGGDVTAPTPGPSPSPSASPRLVAPASVAGAGGARAAAQAAPAQSGALQTSATVTVTIGNAAVTAVRVRADPPRITISNSTHIIATVFGPDGNPMANVPVYFSADSTPGTADIDPTFEFMDSAGRPIFTNQNGEAEDVMRTRRTTVGEARALAVVAGPSGFLTAEVRVPIL